jgi:hypothetical protein
MKKLLFLFVFMTVVVSKAKAQDSLFNFNQKRNEINQTGMKVLSGWALANIAIGSVGFYRTKGATKYFHQMNIFWNVVNLGIATAGFYGAKEASKKQFSVEQSIREQHKTERILLINAGLDVVYLTGGWYLNKRGINKNSDRLRGYGSSIILQGAFLFLFDSSMFAIQKHHSKNAKAFLNKMQIGYNGKQIGSTARL